MDNLILVPDGNCGGQQCVTTAWEAKSQKRCCGNRGLCQSGFCLWDPQGWLLALPLSVLEQMISVLEAAEVGVLIDWLGLAYHTNRSHPGVDKQCLKKKY